MPFVTPPATVVAESLILDGLDLAQGPSGAIHLDAFTPPLFKKRYELVEGSDSDGALLARDPLVTNGQPIIKLGIAGASRDDAETIIGTIVDKLEEADRNPLGIPLVWTPSGSTTSGTCYVLSGEVTEFPVDWESGYMVYQPSLTIALECRPGWYLAPVTISGVATAGPLVTLDLPNVKGDVPAEARLIITESSSQSRRTVEWGAEYLHYNPASPWSLVLDSDGLVTSGFAGTQTTLTGAYDPGAAGNSIISTLVYTSVQAVCGTGVQPHVGTFRVKARINTGPLGCVALSVRLAWRTGDGSYTTNDPVTITDTTQEYLEIDLGLITVPEALLGTQAWDGRVEMWSGNPGDQIYVDYLMLFPVEAGYGKATSSYAYSPGVVVATDAFTGITAGVALNARVAPVGGTWATSGTVTDFVASDFSGGEQEFRSGSADTGFRFAILGATNFTNTEVAVRFRTTTISPTTYAVIARWTDSNNYVYAAVQNVVGLLTVSAVVAGVTTVLATKAITVSGATWHQLRLVALESGTFTATLLSDGGATLASVAGLSSVIATAGALATGKPGFADRNNSGVGGTNRYYDDFYVATPSPEPIALYSGRKIEIRSDDTIRESSAGGTWGHPASYRGSRFKAQPAGTDNRTTRVVAKASRNDLASAQDANLTDQIKLEATITPRCSVVPRA